ncbi:MAG: HAMP domain-containing sensor histidine kinase [Myxococcota bacterium]
MPGPLQTLESTRRREALFELCSLSVVVVSPLFYGVGYVQGGQRMWIVVAMTTIAAIGALVSWTLTRRGHLATGIDTLVGTTTGVILVGTQYSGRAGLVVFLLVVALVMAGIQRSATRMLIDFTVVAGVAIITAATLPPIDPAQLPLLFTMLVLTGLFTFFGSRVNELNHLDLIEANAELQRLNTALDAARQRAEAANEAKSLFLATMSHELRTPLNAVLGYTQMVRQSIADEDLDPAEADEDLERVEKAAGRLLTQVSRILDLTRIEAAEDHEPVDIDVPALIEGIASQHRAAARDAHLDLRVSAPESLPLLHADRDRVARILTDLVENAIRFTPAGHVGISAEVDEEAVVFVVADTGIGISESDRARVFDLFTQVDGSTTRRVDGAGLGLTLCKRLADSMGATLEVDSTLGAGTRFQLRVPGALAAAH